MKFICVLPADTGPVLGLILALAIAFVAGVRHVTHDTPAAAASMR